MLRLRRVPTARPFVFAIALLLPACSAAVEAPPDGADADAFDADLDAASDTDAATDASALDAGEQPEDASSSDDAGPARCDVPTVAPPSDATDLIHRSLGSVGFDANGRSEHVAFELPSDVDSFHVSVRAAEDRTYIIQRVDGPSRALVSDDLPGTPPHLAQLDSPHRVWWMRGGAEGTFTRARHAQGPIVSGTYTLWVATDRTRPAKCRVHVDVYYRLRPVTSARLPIALYFAGDVDLGDDPTADARIVATVRRVQEIYAAVGIDVEVAHAEVVPSITSPGPDIESVLLRVPGPFRGVPVVVVDRLDVLGRAAGIPGDPFTVGGRLSGVIVSLRRHVEGSGYTVRAPADLGRTIAHELGHHLGLHHTTAGLQGFDDQLGDTDVPAPDNLMDAGGDGVRISPLQAIALRSAAVVRAYP